MVTDIVLLTTTMNRLPAACLRQVFNQAVSIPCESFPSGKLPVPDRFPDGKVRVTIEKNLQGHKAPGDFHYFMTIVLSFSD